MYRSHLWRLLAPFPRSLSKSSGVAVSMAIVIFSAPAALMHSRSFFLNEVGVIRVEILSPVLDLTSFTILTRSSGTLGEVSVEMHTRLMKLSFSAAFFVAVVTSERG